jgi:predicted metal-dependent hydrolase
MTTPARPRRNQRPRDELGRPQPYGSETFELPSLVAPASPADALRQAQGLLDAELPFYAHEVLEDAWKIAPEPERDLWQGLAQLAVGRTHVSRGNLPGAITLLRRGADHIRADRTDAPHDIDVDGLLRWAEQTVAHLEADQLRLIEPLHLTRAAAAGSASAGPARRTR